MISSLDDRNQVPSREMAEFLCFKGMRASIVPRSGGIRPVEAAFNCLGVGGSLVLLLKQFFFCFVSYVSLFRVPRELLQQQQQLFCVVLLVVEESVGCN